MKTVIAAILVVLLSATFRLQPVAAGASPPSELDATTQFIFYGVLEGLYEDGVSNQDVDQILMKKENQSYCHFIYACPICTTTIWALQAYRSRPEQFYSLKSPSPTSTFGPGLPSSLRTELFSDDPHRRLKAINTLVKDWIGRRMDRMNLSTKDREALLKALEEKRKQGMEALESLRRHAWCQLWSSRGSPGLLWFDRVRGLQWRSWQTDETPRRWLKTLNALRC